METGENLVILKGHTGFVTGVYFTPDGQHIVTSGQDKSIVIWENKSASPLRTLAGHKNIVFGLGFVARDSTSKTPFTLDEEAPLLVSASYDRTLRVWDTDSGVTVRVLEGYSGGVNGIAVHASQGSNRKEGKSSVRPSGTVRRWDIAPLPHQRLREIPKKAGSTAISHNGRYVAVGFDSGALRL